MTISRNDFLKLGSAIFAGGALPLKRMSEKFQSIKKSNRGAIAIGSSNSIRGVELAYNLMTNDNADPLDAAIEAVKIQELDPDDRTVGIGGLPNERGVVQLDASCMHGPTNRAGAVAALEDIPTAALVAKAVMEYTNHIMLVGADAKRFALDMGFEEHNLLTERSRRSWLRWRARLNEEDNWLDPEDGYRVDWSTGTVHVSTMNNSGDLSSVTTTSGLSYKIPGRVGDSPIIGAGQYCDNRFGTAGSTGRGESVMKICGSFYIVEQMKNGASPVDACKAAIDRIIETTEERLLVRGMPVFNLEFYALSKSGEFGGMRLYAPSSGQARLAVANNEGIRHEPIPSLYDRGDMPTRDDTGVPGN